MILDIIIDGKKYYFKIKSMNKSTLSEMLTRSAFDRGIFLSLVVIEPQLMAHEWYYFVPSTIIDKFIERINEYVEENDV
jgi:hypothetical protein